VHGQSPKRPAVDLAGIDDDLSPLFVKRVQATVKQVKLKNALSYSDTIEPIVAKSVLTRLLTAREEFRQAGKTATISFMTPTLCKAGSWPVEGFDKRNHCIRFYARFGIQLKLSSHLSFIEQVVQCEHYIASGQRKVMTVGDYSLCVSNLQAKMSVPGFSLSNNKLYKMPVEKKMSMKRSPG
jgi:hypothetical protein